jgi:hypothetical protein
MLKELAWNITYYFKICGVPIFRLWSFLMKVILEARQLNWCRAQLLYMIMFMWFNSNTTGGSGIGYIPTAQVNPWLLPVLGFTASDLQTIYITYDLYYNTVMCSGIFVKTRWLLLMISIQDITDIKSGLDNSVSIIHDIDIMQNRAHG